MLKKAWFQIHWFIGITAGVVLAVVGVTGAALSFEHELKRWMNPGVMSVLPKSGAALSPADMLAQVQAAHPGRRITSLSLSSDSEDAARIVFAPKPKDAANKRGETFYLDPYSGELLGKPSGEEFFRLMMQVHRWLAAGDIGKQIVGACTIALVVLCLSGLYLRWPRSALNWRAWLAVDFRHKGRSFLWELHAAAGTWALVLYLLAALTGLYWSYDWYRNALFAITGAPRPAQQQGGPKPAAAKGNEPQRAQLRKSPESPRIDLAIVWPAFQREVSSYRTVTLRLPEKPGQPVQVTYLDADPAHDRANNRLVLDAQSGAVLQHERYSDKPAGAKVMSSMLALHSGSFFGMPGLVAMMLASLLMPLFAITGWMLYLDRRKTKKQLRATRKAAASATTDTGSGVSEWLIGFASQTGFAEQLAWQTAHMLRAAGAPVTVERLGRISQERLGGFRNALFVVSTFGEGEPPDHARSFAKLMHRSPSLGGLRFGLLALGNSRYKTFCGFGRTLDHWLRDRGAQPLFERVEIDNGDPGALKTWQSRLRMLADVSDTEWAEMRYQRWHLTGRRRLNPGSAGAPTFHIVLEPAAVASMLSWQPGDLVDIIPRQPDKEPAALKVLPPRQYSIGSIPQDGAIHLLVRQVKHENGLGVASGWLTELAPIGDEIELRIRSNGAFHMPPGDRPLILIGNGTGLAGLRSHLKARVAGGHRRNWLIFGERNAAHDYYYREEIEAWREQGLLERLDLVFSRDQPHRLYVQDRLSAAAATVREWVGEGATILVCGSLEGMAPGVDRQLAGIIGADALERLVAEGRYRRDVY